MNCHRTPMSKEVIKSWLILLEQNSKTFLISLLSSMLMKIKMMMRLMKLISAVMGILIRFWKVRKIGLRSLYIRIVTVGRIRGIRRIKRIKRIRRIKGIIKAMSQWPWIKTSWKIKIRSIKCKNTKWTTECKRFHLKSYNESYPKDWTKYFLGFWFVWFQALNNKSPKVHKITNRKIPYPSQSKQQYTISNAVYARHITLKVSGTSVRFVLHTTCVNHVRM